ncbi:hypothetical protein [Enterobacter kobei]
MSKTRKKYQEKEERRHPDSPDGLVTKLWGEKGQIIIGECAP